MRDTMDRRAFISGAALGIASLGAAGAARGAAAEEGATARSWMPEWNLEADIVSVGAGGAGLASAVEATSLGLDIIVLESRDIVGGNSRVCNGGIAMAGTPLQQELGYEDSPEKMFEDLMNAGGVDQNENFIRLTSENQSMLWDWLTGMGITFEASGLIGSVGMSVPREHHTNALEAIGILEEKATEQGATILLDTPAKRLIQNPVTKRVIGVEAEDADGKPVYVKARKGVILSTGGFARNSDMLNQWILGEGAETFLPYTFDVEGQNGDGHNMAFAIGAAPMHMSYMSMTTVQNPDGPIGAACAMYHVGAVLVNAEGERFVDESKGYGFIWPDVNNQTGKYCWQVWDDAVAQEYASNASSYYDMEKIKATGLLLQADTIEELAGLMEVPADALTATVKTYNDDVNNGGKDTQFGRECLVSGTGDLVPVDQAPFYAFKTTNAIMTTFGGIKQDDTCRAVDVFGDSIEGLYLAGNISGYCNLGIEPGTRFGRDTSGTGFGGGMAFGRYCADRIAELEDWE